MTIDYNFLSQRYNRDHGTKYRDGVAMIADLYDKLGGAYAVADRLIINHKSIYNFMNKTGLTIQPRGRERITPKKTAVLMAIKKHPDFSHRAISEITGVSEELVRYYRRRNK